MMHASFYISNVDCEAITARIALKLRGMLSLIMSNALLFKHVKKNQNMWEKIPREGGFH